MTQQWSLPAWAAVAGGVVLLVLVAGALLVSSRTRHRLRAEHTAARAETAALRDRLDGVERRLVRPEELGRDPAGFVITGVGLEPSLHPVPDEGVEERLGNGEAGAARTPARVVPAPLFADLVLRESVVQTASLAAGLRRALSPEVRNRVRFAMRQDLKAARRRRRLDLRAARRSWAAQQRRPAGAGAPEHSEGSAA